MYTVVKLKIQCCLFGELANIFLDIISKENILELFSLYRLSSATGWKAIS